MLAWFGMVGWLRVGRGPVRVCRVATVLLRLCGRVHREVMAAPFSWMCVGGWLRSRVCPWSGAWADRSMCFGQARSGMALDVLVGLLAGTLLSGGGGRGSVSSLYGSASRTMDMVSCELAWPRAWSWFIGGCRQSWSRVPPRRPGLDRDAGVGASYGGRAYKDSRTDAGQRVYVLSSLILSWLSMPGCERHILSSDRDAVATAPNGGSHGFTPAGIMTMVMVLLLTCVGNKRGCGG